MNWILITDGACQPNPGRGGWAFILRNEQGEEIIEANCEESSTNNRMELTALLEGMDYFYKNIWTGCEKLNVLSDSAYVVKGIMFWSVVWKKSNWKKKGKTILNLDLWKQLRTLADIINIECQLVKGHSGHVDNERVDKLATESISTQTSYFHKDLPRK